MNLESEEVDVSVAPVLITLVFNSTARVITGGANGFPVIELSGLAGTVRLGFDRSGVDLLLHSLHRLIACLHHGACSTGMPIVGCELEDPPDLADRLRFQRENRNMAIPDFAERVGLFPRDLAKIEQGTIQASVYLVARYARVFDMPIDELLS